MERIFISYKRDDKVKAFGIKNNIEKNVGETCWIDIDGIESDAQFKSVIRRAINNAVIFLFLYSNAHTKIREEDYDDDWTIREYNYANKKKKRIVFVNADNSPLIDPILFDFEGKEQVNALSSNAMRKLYKDLKQWLGLNDAVSLLANEKLDSISRRDTERRLHQQDPREIKKRKKHNSKLQLSYFTGEQHSQYFKRIILLAKNLGYSVKVYESKNSSQFEFIQAIYRDTATIVDATIPDDSTMSTVYPLLTAHINILDHILVFSDTQYEDGVQILPLNITPLRKRTNKNEDLLDWLETQLEDLDEHGEDFYERFEIESIDKLADYKDRMEFVMSASINKHSLQKKYRNEVKKKQVMISYRNSCSKEVEMFRKQEEAKGEVEIKVLPPSSLCDGYEAHSPMRRWMLVGLLEDHIRSVDEVWVYYNRIYTNSWWTLAEMVMVAYINHGRIEEDNVKVKVYDSKKKRFIEESEEDYPAYLHVHLTDSQYQKLARYLSNTRPDTMGPETMRQIDGLKRIARVMRFMTKKKRASFAEQMRPMIEQGVPSDISQEDRDKMVNDLLAMYSDPKAIMAYANDAVFKDEFWNNISYQTERVTATFKDDVIDVDTFIDAPMQELTKFKEEDLRTAADSNSQIKLKGRKYYVGEGKKRYLWLATRMGMPTVKDAPGIEIIQTYNLLTHDQIVGIVMKGLLK